MRSITAPCDDEVWRLFLKPLQLLVAVFAFELDDLGMIKANPSQGLTHTFNTVCAHASRFRVDQYDRSHDSALPAHLSRLGGKVLMRVNRHRTARVSSGYCGGLGANLETMRSC